MAEIVADHDVESGQLPRAGIHHVPPGPCARTPPNATSLKAEDSQIAIAHESGLPDRPARRGIKEWSTGASRATCAIAGQPPARRRPRRVARPVGPLARRDTQSVALVHCSTVFRAGVLAL